MNDEPSRGWAGRLTRLLGGIVGGEPNRLSAETRTAEVAIASLVAALHQLSEQQKGELAGRWHDQSAAARREAWTHGKRVISQRGSSAILDRARADITAWAGLDSRDFSGIDGLLGRPSPEVDDRRVAALAAIDATVGILAADDLDPTHREALCAPWEKTVGPLGLPRATESTT